MKITRISVCQVDLPPKQHCERLNDSAAIACDGHLHLQKAPGLGVNRYEDTLRHPVAVYA